MQTSVVKTSMGIIASILLTGLISGCSLIESADNSTPTATMGNSSSESVEASELIPTSSPTADKILGQSPTKSCSDFVSAEELYEYNPNLTSASQPTELQPPLSEIASAGGLICAFNNLSSGRTIVLGILILDAESIPNIDSRLANIPAQPLSQSSDVLVHYTSENPSGFVQVRFNDAWVVLQSPEFNSSSDASEFLNIVMQKI